jgi:SAM-dependent methyltransferase
LVDKFTVLLSRIAFAGSGSYWEMRYRMRGSSGAGSYGPAARFKADYINRFIVHNDIRSIIDFGCGDGAQIALLKCADYLGIDVSPTAVALCRSRFADDRTKRFSLLAESVGQQADAAISLDVIYHLVEDQVFEAYLDRLFAAARSFVLVYSTNHEQKAPGGSSHVRHRQLTAFCLQRYPEFAFVEESATAADAEPLGARFLAFRKRADATAQGL